MTMSTDIRFVDNVFVKMFSLYSAGDKINGHAHTFDHITLLAKGTVLMRAKGQQHEHAAPKLIVTPKGIEHEFEAVTPDCLLCCIHAVRDGDDVDDVAPPDITEAQAGELAGQFPFVLPSTTA
jgi:quercetin dioxygenase-like cupin family protein